MTNEGSVQSVARLLEIASGYQCSKALFALVSLGIPSLLERGPQSAEQVAGAVGLHPVAAGRLLNACAGLGLLEVHDEQYCNAPIAMRFLVKGSPTYLGDELSRYDRVSYPLWTDLVERMKTWQPGVHPPRGADASDPLATHNLATLTAEALSRHYDFSAHARLLDLGGGTGAMSIVICRAHDRLSAIVYDTPQVARLAETFVRDSGVGDRVEVRAGDLTSDPLPEGFDVALLANVLSMLDEETARKLLGRLHARLPAGGVILLSGWILDDSRTEPLCAALFCLEDIAWHAPDVERSVSTYAAWLEAAGFADVEECVYFPPTRLLSARKRADATAR